MAIMTSACAANDSPAPAITPGTSCELSAGWSIHFTRSGGLAGRSDTLSIDHLGHMSVSSKHPPKNAETTLDAETLLLIERALGGSCPFNNSEVPRCADCFSYTIDVERNGKIDHLELNDLSSNPNGMALVQLLVQTMDAALARSGI